MKDNNKIQLSDDLKDLYCVDTTILNGKPKSILEVGNITIYNSKKFNWLNRLMFKVFFGIKITNIKESE